MDTLHAPGISEQESNQPGVRVIHTIAGVRADHGGPSRSVPALCNALAATGTDVHLLTGMPSDGRVKNNFPAPPVTTHAVRESRLGRPWGVGRGFRRELRRLAITAQTTIVHDHGVWLPTNHAVAQQATALGLPRIVSPRGMLSAWSMNRRRWLKRCLWQLYQRHDLRSATAFVVTSELEARDVRRLGFSQPTIVIPNGIDFPKELPQRQPQATKQLLFLSRIHPKKGVLELVEAFSQARLPDAWQLVIAGPDEDGHRRQVERRIQQLGIDNRFRFTGPVDDQAKWQLYVDADLFVLPSFTENFGIVVAEAMAAGLPVITTTGTPWNVLQEQQLGWHVEPTVAALRQALSEACSLPNSKRIELGLRARDFAIREFAWHDVGARMLDFYSAVRVPQA